MRLIWTGMLSRYHLMGVYASITLMVILPLIWKSRNRSSTRQKTNVVYWQRTFRHGIPYLTHNLHKSKVSLSSKKRKSGIAMVPACVGV